MDRQRAEVSEKNLFWIEKHRYLELRQFCLQYPTWQRAKAALIVRSGNPGSIAKTEGTADSSVEKIFYAICMYDYLIGKVEQAVSYCEPWAQKYVLKGVTEGCSYETMNAQDRLPCCRALYYKEYRKFFYALNKIRDTA